MEHRVREGEGRNREEGERGKQGGNCGGD